MHFDGLVNISCFRALQVLEVPVFENCHHRFMLVILHLCWWVKITYHLAQAMVIMKVKLPKYKEKRQKIKKTELFCTTLIDME